MTTLTKRYVFGVVAAALVLGGAMLAPSNASADQLCHRIAHWDAELAAYEEIVVNHRGWERGHQRQHANDYLVEADVECPVDEIL